MDRRPRRPKPRPRPLIAIDGPAGVGKSTVGKRVARRLGFHFLNTGEMYRALTWKALQEGVAPGDADRLVALARRLKWTFKAEDGVLRTVVDGVVIGPQIRQEEVSRNSSLVAGVPDVRRHLRRLQRALGRSGGIVMEGRDITTIVFPDAEFKFYLDASLEERARRRYRQLKTQGLPGGFDAVRDDIDKRDRQDSQRKINPLKRARDATVIDSTQMTLHEVADCILRTVQACAKKTARGD